MDAVDECEKPTTVCSGRWRKPVALWVMLALWIAYYLSARDIPMGARAWSVAFAGGFLTIGVQTSVSLLILRDPPKSLSRRLLAHAGVIVLVLLSLVTWVLTLGWLEAAP
jgi:hypothetical protein